MTDELDEYVPPPPGAPKAGGRSPLAILGISLGALLVIVLCGFGIASAAGDGGGGSSREVALRSAAGKAGHALLTYDFNAPQAHKDRVLELSTGSFRDEYARAFDQGLGELITKGQAVSEGFVKDVYISEIDHERGEAIVVLDVNRDGVGGKRTLYDIYVLLTFVDIDGTWKVDQVTDLNFATEGSQPSTTSTSAPVP